jgi:hypothetical protein
MERWERGVRWLATGAKRCEVMLAVLATTRDRMNKAAT